MASESFESDDGENFEDEYKRMKSMSEKQIRRMTQTTPIKTKKDDSNEDPILKRAKSSVHLNDEIDD